MALQFKHSVFVLDPLEDWESDDGSGSGTEDSCIMMSESETGMD